MESFEDAAQRTDIHQRFMDGNGTSIEYISQRGSTHPVFQQKRGLRRLKDAIIWDNIRKLHVAKLRSHALQFLDGFTVFRDVFWKVRQSQDLVAACIGGTV